jgi:hypothetical protein
MKFMKKNQGKNFMSFMFFMVLCLSLMHMGMHPVLNVRCFPYVTNGANAPSGFMIEVFMSFMRFMVIA